MDTQWTIGVLGFDSRRELGVFLFTTASRTALGPTQPPIQYVPGSLSLRLKWQECEADQIYCWDQECVELYLHSPIRSVKKHRDNSNFHFYLYVAII
jgi:hypothetical protein